MNKRILLPIKGKVPYTYTNKAIVFYNTSHWIENLSSVESIVLGIVEPNIELNGWLIVNDVNCYAKDLQFLPVNVVFDENGTMFRFVVNDETTDWFTFKNLEYWDNYEFPD